MLGGFAAGWVGVGRLAVVSIAVVCFYCAPAQALDMDAARHLLFRTGFGAPPDAIAQLAPLNQKDAVRRLLDGAIVAAQTPVPEFLNRPRPDWSAYYKLQDQKLKDVYNRERDAEIAQLKAWWFTEMIGTPSPLTEHMVLFWHNHFTSSMDKVRAPDLLYRQNILFRRHATGSFRELLHAVAHDPAMIKYLDTIANKLNGPNENFARELLELFTLGEGHYSEREIKEVARAFSGWQIDERTGDYRFNGGSHDYGMLNLFGETGQFNGDKVLDIILEQPAAATFITTKMWREFVSPDPDKAEVARLAEVFRKSDYNIRALLEAMLTSPAFTAAANRGVLIKSPVELMVGAIRTFGIPVADTRPLVDYGRRMRQDIFNPPNVRGWLGGTDWISTYTLLERRDVVARLLNGAVTAGVPPSPAMGGAPGMGGAMGGGMGGTPTITPVAAMVAPPGPGNAVAWWNSKGLSGPPQQIEHMLLAVPPVDPVPQSGERRELIEKITFDPAYQVK